MSARRNVGPADHGGKTDRWSEDTGEEIIMDVTPRPSINIHHLSASHTEGKARRKGFKCLLKTVFDLSSADRKTIRRVLSRYRRRQTRLLGARDDDPDPYATSYIFYCLDGPRET